MMELIVRKFLMHFFLLQKATIKQSIFFFPFIPFNSIIVLSHSKLIMPTEKAVMIQSFQTDSPRGLIRICKKAVL